MSASKEPAPQAIREQLQRVLTSPGFLHSDRLRRFLTHCVEATLSGRIDDLKEYSIGVAAFDRPSHYNPAEDPIVRVEARRLRKKLDEYYQAHTADPVIIQLPKGGYLPLFEMRSPEALPVPEVVRPPDPPVRRRLWLAVACVLIVAAVCVWWFGHQPDLPELALSRITSNRGLTTDPALSADGSLLAYASDRAGTGGLDIWIQSVSPPPAGLAPRQLTLDPADDSQPAISPDRSTVVFRSERQPPGIYSVPVTGGPAQLLVPDGRNPRYSPDGRQIAYWVGAPGGDSLPPAGKVFVMPATGGTPRRLLARMASAACPEWSPDGRSLLVEAIETPADGFDLRSTSLSEERITVTGIARALEQAHLRFALRECSLSWGREALVFSALDGDTQSLWRLPVQPDGRPVGRLVRSTYGSADEALPFAAASGAIAFAGRSESLSVWRLPVDPPGELTRITSGASATFPEVHGDRLAFLSKTEGRPAVWLQDLRNGQAIPLTPGGEPQYPKLCPDGQTVVYSEGPNTFAVSPSSPVPRLLCNGCARVWQCTGRGLFFVPAGSKTPVPINEFRLPDGPSTPLLASPDHDLANAQKSADGWLAFHVITGPTGRQILTARYRPGASTPPGEWIPITDGSQMDRNAAWNDRSDTLYFLSERCGFRCIWAQRLDAATKKPLGEPVVVRHFHSARQGLSAIGDVGAIGLSFAGGSLYFAQAEQSGDAWLARPVSHQSQVSKQ